MDDRHAPSPGELAELTYVAPKEGGRSEGAAALEQLAADHRERCDHGLHAGFVEPSPELTALRKHDEGPVPSRVEAVRQQLELAIGSVASAGAAQEEHGPRTPRSTPHAHSMSECRH